MQHWIKPEKSIKHLLRPTDRIKFKEVGSSSMCWKIRMSHNSHISPFVPWVWINREPKIFHLLRAYTIAIYNTWCSDHCLYLRGFLLTLHHCFLRRHQSMQAFIPVLDLPVYALPFFSSPWLSPLVSIISSSLPLLLPFYLSTFNSFQPRSREFAISPWPM
jgi:hypothetical protein